MYANNASLWEESFTNARTEKTGDANLLWEMTQIFLVEGNILRVYVYSDDYIRLF